MKHFVNGLVKAETSFFLDALDFRLDLDIRQNIIRQLFQPIRQSFLPPKFCIVRYTIAI